MANTAASSLITSALDNCSRAAAGTTRSGATLESRALEALNHTLQVMSRAYDFTEMRVTSSGVAGTSITVASTKTYTFPDDWKDIHDIRLVSGLNSRRLTLMRKREFDKLVPYPEGDTTGKPLFYIPWGNSFDLFPIPDAAYTMYIYYVKVPATITVTTTTIDYDTTRDDVVKAGMTSELFFFLQMYEDGAAWRKIFKDLLKEAILDDMYLTDWDPASKGFDSYSRDLSLGDYYNNPMIFKNP